MNDLAWAIVGAVLWLVVGGAGVVFMWMLTLYCGGLLAFLDKTLESVLVIVGGIILTLSALCLVVYSVTVNVITIIQIAINGG